MKKHPNEQYPIKEKAKDIFLDREESRAGCLLLHGFTASPYNLKTLAEYLHKKGFVVSVPRLAGHGTHYSDLEKMTMEDWIYSAREAFLELKEKTDKIIIIGTSLGSNLALRLANEFPKEIKGVILVSTSVYLKKHFLIKSALPLVNRLRIKKTVSKRDVSPENLDNYIEEGNYTLVPLKGVAQILKLIYQYSLDDIKIFTHPSLVIHSRHDRVVRLKSSRFVYENIKSETKELIIIDSMDHYPVVNSHGTEVLDKIHNFILKIMPERQ